MFEQDISIFHSQTQIAVAALVFQIRSNKSFEDRRRQILHYLIKRLRIVYIPGLSGKLPRESDLADANI